MFYKQTIVLETPRSLLVESRHLSTTLGDCRRRQAKGLAAIKEEGLAHGSNSDIEVMNYILNEQAGSSKKKFQNGLMLECQGGVVLTHPAGRHCRRQRRRGQGIGSLQGIRDYHHEVFVSEVPAWAGQRGPIVIFVLGNSVD
jgi:hypothetical protein